MPKKRATKDSDSLNALMNNVPDTIYFKDRDSRFTRISQAQANLLGIDNPSDAIGKRDIDFFTKKHSKEAYKDEQEIIKSGNPLISKVERIRKADGHFLWVSATKVPIKDKKGRVIGLVGISRNITKQKRAESALRKIQGELEQRVKERTAELSKSNIVLKKEIKERKKAEKALIESNRRQQNIAQKLKDMNTELLIAKKKIEQLNRELEGKVRRRTKELEDANKKVSKILRLRTQFINQIAHDLRTPLTPIIALTPVIARKLKDRTLRKHFKVLTNNVNFLSLLVNDTLNLARLSAGYVIFHFDYMDIRELIARVVSDNKTFFQQKSVRVINKIGKGLPSVFADKLKMTRVLENLLMNAVRAMPKGGKIILNAKKTNEALTVSFKDTGIGMTPEVKKNVFQEFFKTDNPSYRHTTGLGLPICKNIIKKHRGRIWGESPGPNKGATFYFSLPINNKVRR